MALSNNGFISAQGANQEKHGNVNVTDMILRIKQTVYR